ncbi:MAG: hypothetical protein JRG95_19590 [Deltaproteobacteria bacterium]|nr:hypothetical protein [Deltaproteobacteria bacterium]
MVLWCLALLLTLVGWWMMGWASLRAQTEIGFSTLFMWIVTTALLYLAWGAPSSRASVADGMIATRIIKFADSRKVIPSS